METVFDLITVSRLPQQAAGSLSYFKVQFFEFWNKVGSQNPINTKDFITALSRAYLQQPVSCLEAAILDSSSPRQNVLHIDGCRAPDGNIPRRYAEAESLGACGMSG